MDSPRSEKSDTRFSTPVSDLDDHRFQPSSLPRADTLGSTHNSPTTHRGSFHNVPGTRRGTAQTATGENRPTLDPNLAGVTEGLRFEASTSKDWEHAVVDEDNEKSALRGDEGGRDDGRAASSPLARRGTLKYEEPAERAGRSRSSSTSSFSSSPPNSVDAFADPRRRERAGTVGSKAPSDPDLALGRTASRGASFRCPTFNESVPVLGDPAIDTASKHGSADGDVCLPFVEPSKAYTIDFEALEEFVAEESRGRSPERARHRTHSISSRSQAPRVFSDLRPKGSYSAGANGAAPAKQQSDESGAEDGLQEKLRELDLAADRPTQAEPNRFSFFSSELDSTIHAAEIGDLVMPGDSFRDLFELAPAGGVWWLDVLNPSEEEIGVLTKAFSIHPLTSEDIKTQETREKVELFKQYYFVCFRSFYQVEKTSEDYMEPVNVYAVVFREGVISFTFRPSPHAANVRLRIGKLRDYVALSSDWICYAMIDDIVDNFGPVIHDIERETDVIEDQVFVARVDDVGSLLRQIGECRKKVMGVMRLLGGKADVIKGFAKRCNEHYSITPRGEIGLYLGDIQDHVVTMMSNLGHFEKMLSRSHSNHLAQLSIDSLEQGNHANRVLSKITIIATILVPLNLICGLFGMNVPVPGKESGGLGWFFGILGVIFAIVIFSLLMAKRFRFI
ncbi:MAG: Mg(2+) transporter [Thelocarpon impressellum]|nr:MAG: Mg(2+) transporter [Thelocarpon impressellum]